MGNVSRTTVETPQLVTGYLELETILTQMTDCKQSFYIYQV